MYAWNNISLAEKIFASSAAYNAAFLASGEKSVGITIVCITEDYAIKLGFFNLTGEVGAAKQHAKPIAPGFH